MIFLPTRYFWYPKYYHRSRQPFLWRQEEFPSQLTIGGDPASCLNILTHLNTYVTLFSISWMGNWILFPPILTRGRSKINYERKETLKSTRGCGSALSIYSVVRFRVNDPNIPLELESGLIVWSPATVNEIHEDKVDGGTPALVVRQSSFGHP